MKKQLFAIALVAYSTVAFTSQVEDTASLSRKARKALIAKLRLDKEIQEMNAVQQQLNNKRAEGNSPTQVETEAHRLLGNSPKNPRR